MCRMKTLHQNKLSSYAKQIVELVKEFRTYILIIIAYFIVSELAEQSFIDLAGTLFRTFVYPINWLVYDMEFTKADVPEVFILMVPLVFLFSIGLIIIISTED